MQSPTTMEPMKRTRKKRRTRLQGQRTSQSDRTIPREEVLAALQRILASKDFAATGRNRRFLEFVVRQALDGRFEKIDGYHVATEVFGRAPDFDPMADPIVRIEASKLRRDLEVYYLKRGEAGQVCITLPRGGYIPVFQRCAVESGSREAVYDLQSLSVHALHNGTCALSRVEPPFRARLVDRLVRQSGLSIFAGPAAINSDGLLDSDTARDLGRRNSSRFILSGDAHPGGDGAVAFTARMHDGQTGQLLWSEGINGDPELIEDILFARALEVHRYWAGKFAAEAVSPGFVA